MDLSHLRASALANLDAGEPERTREVRRTCAITLLPWPVVPGVVFDGRGECFVNLGLTPRDLAWLCAAPHLRAPLYAAVAKALVGVCPKAPLCGLGWGRVEGEIGEVGLVRRDPVKDAEAVDRAMDEFLRERHQEPLAKALARARLERDGYAVTIRAEGEALAALRRGRKTVVMAASVLLDGFYTRVTLRKGPA